MPSYVSTTCVVTGPPSELDRLKATCFTGAERLCFDFETILPMPEALRQTDDGSDTALGYEAILEAPYPLDNGEDQDADRIPAYRWGKFAEQNVRSYAELVEWLTENDPDVLDAGYTCIKALTETGYLTWYKWAVDHWGTKWNAVSTTIRHDRPKRLVFSISTAWAHPVPVFNRLRTMFPQLAFRLTCNGHESRSMSYPCSRGQLIPPD